MLTTSFRLLAESGGLANIYRAMGEHLGGSRSYGRDTPISLRSVLDRLGVDDAMACLRCVQPGQEAERDRIARTFAVACAERVLPLYERFAHGDDRPRRCIEVARSFVTGLSDSEELDAAWSAAVKVAISGSSVYQAAYSASSAAMAHSADAAWFAADFARDAVHSLRWDDAGSWESEVIAQGKILADLLAD